MDCEELVVAQLVRYVNVYVIVIDWYVICDVYMMSWLWVDCHVCESDDWVYVGMCVWSLSS